MKKCLFRPDSNLSFKECCLKNAPVSPSDLDYGNYTHSEDKKWCNAIGAIYTSGSIPKCECKIKINSTTTKQFSWDSMGTCSVKTSTTNGEITQTKEFFEECLRTLLNEHFFNNMITPLTTLSNVTKLNCSAISDSGGGTGGGSGGGTGGGSGGSGGNGGGSGGGTGGENPTPPENPPTPPAPPTLTPEQECTAAGKIWDATNEKCITQEEKACIDAGLYWDDINSKCLTKEEREKAACVAAGSDWTDNDYVTENATCRTQESSDLGWGAIWNPELQQYRCINAITYADLLYGKGKLKKADYDFRYQQYSEHVYGMSNGAVYIKPLYKNLRWYVPPITAKYPSAARCVSDIEMQCYDKNGYFAWTYDWDNPDSTGKCYTHSGDKTWCEAIGAKFKTENGLSFCDCKLKNENKEFHWDSNGKCDYKINSSQKWAGGDFFEYCLITWLKEPFFNGNLYTTTGGLFNHQTVLKKLNCE